MSDDLSRIESVFHAVLELTPAERTEYFDKHFPEEADLRRRVEELLAASDSDPAFLSGSMVESGLAVFGSISDRDLSGQTIGPYEIESKIGSGGMGEVYLARDVRLNRRVAVKFLHDYLLNDDRSRRRLVREAKAVAMLEHPNICTVYGYEVIEGYDFIVMQYIDGDPLSKLIRNGDIDSAKASGIARQLVSAIAAAHQQGILHRDIKPANLMLTRAGQIKVLDFGLAKTVEDEDRPVDPLARLSQLTSEGLVPGTVAYMSPEQLRAEPLDLRSDVFSLGIVLYELATGKNPFERENDADTISAILDPRTLARERSDVTIPAALSGVVRKCLDPEKERRYSSAVEVLADLERPAQPTERARGSRWKWIAAAVTILAIVIGLGFFFLTPSKNRWTVAASRLVNESGSHVGDELVDRFPRDLIRLLSTRQNVDAVPYVPNAENDEQSRNANFTIRSTLVRRGADLMLIVNLTEGAGGKPLRVVEKTYRPDQLGHDEADILDKLVPAIESSKPVS